MRKRKSFIRSKTNVRHDQSHLISCITYRDQVHYNIGYITVSAKYTTTVCTSQFCQSIIFISIILNRQRPCCLAYCRRFAYSYDEKIKNKNKRDECLQYFPTIYIYINFRNQICQIWQSYTYLAIADIYYV